MTRLAPSVWRLARAVARREWRVIVAVGLFVAVTAAGAAAILSRSSVQVVSPERVRAAFAGGADMVVSENPGSIISMGSQVGPRGGCCPGPGLSNAAALRDHLELPRGTRSLTADIVGVRVVRPTDDRSSGMLTLIQMDLTAGAIYVVRNPLDLVLSLADHYGVDIDKAIEVMNDPNNGGMADGNIVFEIHSTWSVHVKSWTGRPHPGLLPVRAGAHRHRGPCGRPPGGGAAPGHARHPGAAARCAVGCSPGTRHRQRGRRLAGRPPGGPVAAD